MKTNPEVSIIMPVYNSEKFVSEAIESVLTQTFANLELIVIDDGSNDNSVSIVKEYQKKDNRVILFCQENMGVSCARNKGMLYARGKFIFFLDSDDIYYSNFIERMMEVKILTGADYVCCNFDMGFHLHKKEYTKCLDGDISIYDQSSIEAFDSLCQMGLGTSISNKLFLTENVRKYNISFDSKMSYGEDFFFCWKNCLISKKIAYLPEKLYFYRQSANSAVSRIHFNLFEKYDSAFKDIERFACEHNLMCDNLKQSIAVNFVRRLPAILCMTAREKRGLISTYRRIKEMLESERMKKVYFLDAANLNGNSRKLFIKARQRKFFEILILSYYSNLRVQFVRKVKGNKI